MALDLWHGRRHGRRHRQPALRPLSLQRVSLDEFLQFGHLILQVTLDHLASHALVLDGLA